MKRRVFFDKDSDYDGALGHSILAVVRFIAGQHHSGGSVAMTFAALAAIYDEYENAASPIWQAYRASDEGKKLKAQFEGTDQGS